MAPKPKKRQVKSPKIYIRDSGLLHTLLELDLLITVAGKRYGFEIKFSESVGTTRSMRTAITDLELEHLWIVYPGTHCYRIDQKISTLSVDKVCQLIEKLKQGQPHALTDH